MAQADSTPQEDVDYLRAWADSRPTLSCALWQDTADLEKAQERKLERIAELAGVRPGMDVLDVGCGFGGMLDHLVRHGGARSAHGIDPDGYQCREILRRATPGVSVDCLPYAAFRPTRRFDAVVSISALEYVTGSGVQGQREEVTALRDFFLRAHQWTKPDAGLAVEVVVIGPKGLERRDTTEGKRHAGGGDATVLRQASRSAEYPRCRAGALGIAVGADPPAGLGTDAGCVALAGDRRPRGHQCPLGSKAYDATIHYLALERETFTTGRLSAAHLAFRRTGEE
ncbi:Methyltransferase domain-containing protein OS=Streptomyces rimosus subsp. rimosus (strain ATCC/ DSM 40260 / JCM 4667 / NRRL 2234) OX=1265868 GN=SRIM_005720 PE=3 SV=1 [Streptomyces rimosus subsp. rimosus]